MDEKKKIGREAFLYMEKHKDGYGNPNQFAQCSECVMWTGEKGKTCTILGRDFEVNGSDTCGIFVNGPNHEDMIGKEMALVTPEEAGFYQGQVRCENCIYFNPTISQCKLFFILQSEFPSDFNLKDDSGTFRVSPLGCCNANIPVKFKENKE